MPIVRCISCRVGGACLAIASLSMQDVAGAQRPSPSTIAASVDSLAQRAIAAGVAPALGLAIVMDGRTIHRRGYGMTDASAGIRANDETLWYIASTSKSLTGFAVSLLVEQGALTLNAPITSQLPGVTWHAGVQADSLSLKQFLTHTHHLDDNAVVMSAAFTGEIPEQRWPTLIALAKPSGTQDLVYSNFGYNVAAMVIDRVRPEGWRQFLEDAVYKPAGMRHTFARVSGLDTRHIAKPHLLRPDGRYVTETFFKTDATMNSAGGHLATVGDLARWTIVQMDSGVIDGRQVFLAAAIARSQQLLARHTRDQAKRFAWFDRDGWGAGWDLGSYDGERMVSRFGGYSTFRSHLSFLPRKRIGVIAITTGGLGSSLTDLLATFTYDLEAAQPDARTRAEQRLADLIARLVTSRRTVASRDSVREQKFGVALDRALSDFPGRFTAPAYGSIVIDARAGRLHYRWGAVSGPLVPDDVPKASFVFEVAGADMVMSFDLPRSGVASSLTVNGVTFTRSP